MLISSNFTTQIRWSIFTLGLQINQAAHGDKDRLPSLFILIFITKKIISHVNLTREKFR